MSSGTTIQNNHVGNGGHQTILVSPGSDNNTTIIFTALKVTDPKDDRDRIEKRKDGLLRACCEWLFTHSSVNKWREWRDGSSEDTRLLWIKGDPGKGKTMLMIGLSKELELVLPTANKKYKLSYFFCEAGMPSNNNAVAILRGIIYSLVCSQNGLLAHVKSRYDKSGPQLFTDHNAFNALSSILSDVLSDARVGNIYLMIDGLDECVSGLEDLLKYITETTCHLANVKWILSSRNWRSVEESIRSTNGYLNISLELNDTSVGQAVETFIDAKARQLKDRRAYSDETFDTIRKVVKEKASGTFLWVALVFQELQRKSARHSLDILKDIPPGLDPLYKRMLDNIRSLEPLQLRDVDVEYFQKILGCAILAFRPLHLEELCPVALDNTQTQYLEELINDCGSFLVVKEGFIHFVHLSARDYADRYENSWIFPDGKNNAHSLFLDRILRQMSQMLKKDICDLKIPEPVQNELWPGIGTILRPLRYACTYWLDHLEIESIEKLLDDGPVHTFLLEHFLHWVEVAALAKSMFKVIKGIQSLSYRLQSVVPGSWNLSLLVQDAIRLLLTFRTPIEIAPLQIYVSALLFSPEASILKKQFWDQRPHWFNVWPEMEESWSQLLQTLKPLTPGHYDGQRRNIFFSSDGTRIISNVSNTIFIWDSYTGEELHSLDGSQFGFHGENAECSADQKYMLSYRIRGFKITIRWLQGDKTGAILKVLNSDHEILSAIFSPDGRYIIVAFDHEIQIWCFPSGIIKLKHTIEGYWWRSRYYVMSSESKYLALYRNSIVALWNFGTGNKELELQYDNKWNEREDVTSLAFTSNSKLLLVVVSSERDVRLEVWNIETKAMHNCRVLIREFSKSYWDRQTSFSSDTTRVLIPHSGKTVSIFNVATGELEISLSNVRKISNWDTSPDGKHVAVLSCFGEVNMWNIDPAFSSPRANRYFERPYHTLIDISPKGELVVSASTTGVVWLWNYATGKPPQKLQAFLASTHFGSSPFHQIKFSPDGTRVALLSMKEVRLCDMRTKIMSRCELNGSSYSWLAFSMDTKFIALINSDKIRLCDVETGTVRNTVNFQYSSLHFNGGISFLRDSKHIVCVRLWRNEVAIWDIASSEAKALAEIPGLGNAITTRAAVSLDGHCVVLGENGSMCTLLHTGRWEHKHDSQRRNFRWIEFDTNGQFLHTDLGDVSLEHPGKEWASGIIPNGNFSPVALSRDKDWIQWKGHNILWLPPDTRPLSIEERPCKIRGNTIAMNTKDGRVMIIRFKLNAGLCVV